MSPELDRIENLYNNVSDVDALDYAIYQEKALRSQFDLYLKDKKLAPVEIIEKDKGIIQNVLTYIAKCIKIASRRLKK